MNKICTSIEQSKKLMELGIDTNTADMYWDYDVIKHEDYPMVMDEQFDDCCISAWSLSALLGLIPKPLLGQHLESGYWECTTWEDFNVVKEVHGQDNPLDAAFEMVVWLKENGKI
jgi:hypothetical protein